MVAIISKIEGFFFLSIRSKVKSAKNLLACYDLFYLFNCLCGSKSTKGKSCLLLLQEGADDGWSGVGGDGGGEGVASGVGGNRSGIGQGSPVGGIGGSHSGVGGVARSSIGGVSRSGIGGVPWSGVGHWSSGVGGGIGRSSGISGHWGCEVTSLGGGDAESQADEELHGDLVVWVGCLVRD